MKQPRYKTTDASHDNSLCLKAGVAGTRTHVLRARSTVLYRDLRIKRLLYRSNNRQTSIDLSQLPLLRLSYTPMYFLFIL